MTESENNESPGSLFYLQESWDRVYTVGKWEGERAYGPTDWRPARKGEARWQTGTFAAFDSLEAAQAATDGLYRQDREVRIGYVDGHQTQIYNDDYMDGHHTQVYNDYRRFRVIRRDPVRQMRNGNWRYGTEIVVWSEDRPEGAA